MIETRVYIADLNSWYSSSSDEENIIECAESEGTVYTLDGYVRAWNNGEVSELDGENTMMCIADIDTNNGNIVKIYRSEE